MEIVIIAVLVVFLGLIAGGVAFFVMRRNQINQKNAPIERVFVTVGGTYTETKTMNKNFTSSTVDSYNGYEQKSFYIHFRTKKNQKLSFRVSKKMWLTFHDGDQGMLTYQGYKILKFEPKKEIESEFKYFITDEKELKPYLIYGQADKLGVSIDSKKPMPCLMEELKLFIKDLKDDASDWFFTIKKDEKHIYQYEKDEQDLIMETDLSNHQTSKIELNKLYEHIKRKLEG